MAGYAEGPITKPPSWHGLVAAELLLNGLSTGLFLVAALAELTVPVLFASVAKAAYLIALALLLIDLLLLTIDLGDPWRFHHMLRVFKPTSPMSLGVWCLTAWSLPLVLAAALGLLADAPAWIEVARRAAVIAALIPAFGSAIYKGVLFSTSAQPVWRDARWLGAYLATSALALGCGSLHALAVLLGEEASPLAFALFAALLIHLTAAMLLRESLAADQKQPWFGLGNLALAAVVIPLCVLFARHTVLHALIADGLLLVGALIVRIVIVTQPHPS
jgi:hypothetical protein